MTLRLTLHKKWFDEIASGEKRIEYRENKPYWNTRLDGKEFEAVCFKNGYSSKAPMMIIECKQIIKFADLYHIHLGEILQLCH